MLGQQKVSEKSNEITAIPALSELLVVKGCLFTIDAMGCQINIAEKIIDKEADYLLAVKENQEVLLDDIREAAPVKDSYKGSNVGHGRVETRITSVIEDPDWICRKDEWQNLSSLIKVACTRYDKKTSKEETSERYYISSKKASAQYFHEAVRTHWQVENNLHWTLDVIFSEDDSKKRAGNSVQNFSLISKVALNMIGNHQDTRNRGAKKISAKRKRKWPAGTMTTCWKSSSPSTMTPELFFMRPPCLLPWVHFKFSRDKGGIYLWEKMQCYDKGGICSLSGTALRCLAGLEQLG